MRGAPSIFLSRSARPERTLMRGVSSMSCGAHDARRCPTWDAALKSGRPSARDAERARQARAGSPWRTVWARRDALVARALSYCLCKHLSQIGEAHGELAGGACRTGVRHVSDAMRTPYGEQSNILTKIEKGVALGCMVSHEGAASSHDPRVQRCKSVAGGGSGTIAGDRSHNVAGRARGAAARVSSSSSIGWTGLDRVRSSREFPRAAAVRERL
jgi:hypothetical protein